jgi:hypothetical protein
MKLFTLSSAATILLAGGVLGSSSAIAQTTTNIAIPYTTNGLTQDWSGANNGSQIAAAPTNGNTGTGITFADWSGQFNQISPGGSTVFNIGTSLGADTSVNTLLNTFYGLAGTNDATIIFTDSNNDTATFDLGGNDTIRDYNQNNYINDLGDGGSTLGVTAQNWWNNDGNGQRLDVQTFILPASWNGTTLVSMTVTNPTTGGANPNPDDVLSALQVISDPSVVTSPVPEPSSLVLLGTGALTLAGSLRRKFSRA